MFGILQYFEEAITQMDSWCESAKVPPPNIIVQHCIVKHGLHVCYVVMLYCGGWCPHERGRATTGVMFPLSRAGHTGDTGDTVWTNRIPPPWSPVTAAGRGT